jgi:hypothetical protein
VVTLIPSKVLTTDIPTAESLKLTSRVTSQPDDPPLPPSLPADTSLKRDEWMLAPSGGSVPIPSTSKLQPMTGDESLTEDYGEPSGNSRTLGGDIDFFSSLGTEHKKKPKEKPELEKVCCPSLSFILKPF